MAFIAIFSVVLSSSFFFLFSYSLQSLVVDMVVTSQKSFMPDPSSFDMPDPNSFSSADPSSFTPTAGFNYSAQITGQLGHLKEDFALLLAVQIAFFLPFPSSPSSLPLITTFYVSGLAIGYFVVVVMLAAPLLMYRNLATLSVAILLGTTSFTFYLYLFVAWALAIVVSVVEERCYGMDALGKAAALVKGKRLHGFLLNICFNLVVLIIFQGYKMILGNKVLVNPTIYGLVVLNVSSLVKIFLVVAYTVLYFQCKKDHGEEIELHGSLQYTKLATDMP
ncbi:hypothetical protein Pfo_029576 [Paulownia fortunei]|nr:hypothetical protein Pfo_029576 [Paulownia fortunei]